MIQGLGPRLVTGLFLAALAVVMVLLAPLWLLGLLVALLAGICMWEAARLVLPGQWDPAAILGVALAGLTPLAGLAGAPAAAGALGAALGLLTLAVLASPGPPALRLEAALKRGWTLLYCTLGLTAALVTAGLPGGRRMLIFLVVAVVAADVGAYFTGHAVGKRPLAPQLSPKKTIEGLLGGMLLATVLGVIGGGFLLPTDSPLLGGALALVLGVVSVAGDLLESLLKRAAGVKDSGGLLPGHGGLLDRVDGLIIAAPFALLARGLFW